MIDAPRLARPGSSPGDVVTWPVELAADGCAPVAAEHGVVTVPARHGATTSDRFELAFVRIAARAPVDRGRACVYLAGGPGESGIDDAGWPPVFRGLAALARATDVLVLDQRGVGSSRPNLSSAVRWNLPMDRAGSDARDLPIVRGRIATMRDHWVERGVDLGAFTTEESADDVGLVARALGYERLLLLGSSYGSHLGLSVIRRHGPLVERAVLGLVEGPDHTFKLPSAVERTFTQLQEAGLGPPGPDTVAGVLERALDRLDGGIVVHDDAGPVTVGGDDLRRAVAGHLGHTPFVVGLPAWLARLDRGELGWLATEARRARTGSVGNAMSWATDAASGASADRLARIEQETVTGVLGDALNWPIRAVAGELGVDLGDAFRAPVASDVPVLLVSGELDVRTPVANADEVAAWLPNAVQLVIEGAAHLYGWIGMPTALEVVQSWFAGSTPTTDRIARGTELDRVAAED